MNWTQIEGRWEQMRSDAKTKWGKLTDHDLHVVGGQLDRLVGKIVERYGVKREQAQKDIEEWAERLRTKLDAVGKRGRPRDTSAGRDRESNGTH